VVGKGENRSSGTLSLFSWLTKKSSVVIASFLFLGVCASAADAPMAATMSIILEIEKHHSDLGGII
jgi:hypothetical protein